MGGNTRDGSTPFSRMRKPPQVGGFRVIGSYSGGACASVDEGYAPALTAAETKVRKCEPRDVPEVMALWEQARSGHASTSDRIDDVERLIADSPAALLVAEREGEIVGVLIAGWDGWRGNMYRLAVRDGYRREGIGSALTRAAEDYLRSCGARRVTALVAFEDEVAAGFWDSAGYPLDREIGRRVRNI